MYLNDSDIRPSLIEFLNSRSKKPRRILQELHVHRGNAIADVVTVHSEAHCYEIKGDRDKIDRLARQGDYYNKVFSKITLVTTESKLEEALKKTPAFWGVVIAYKIGKVIKFKYIRKTSPNPFFDKKLALATLWKSELTNVNGELRLEIPEKTNKRDFALELADRLNKIQTNRWIAESLVSRMV